MDDNRNIDSELENAIISFCDSLTDEQRKKAKTGELQQELLKVLCKDGIELPDEVLDSVSGGKVSLWPFDPKWWPEGCFMRGLMEKICGS
ncbi:MAG: hypothetical protein K6E68_08410 [Lachnospiraceae bacterium]|nr:hypothetical protein [Lachnospiraceae bacterium]